MSEAFKILVAVLLLSVLYKLSKGKTYRWPVNGIITSKFGMRVHPVTGEHKLHKGIDIAADPTAVIYPAVAGVVSFAGYSDTGGYMVVIDSGNIQCRYLHMSILHVVTGQSVETSTPLGVIGSSGLSSGIHLHFDMSIDGDYVDPELYLA